MSARRSAGTLTAAVIALTLAGSAHAAPTTRAAAAAAPTQAAPVVAAPEPAPAVAAPEPAPAPVEPAAPLQLRPEHQSAFAGSAPAGSSSSLPNWILGLVGLGGLAFVAFKKKQQRDATTRPTPILVVRARASMGARSSVVVVEVEGQALLLGITPTQISLLTTLEEPARPSEAPRARSEAPAPAPALDPRERLAALLAHSSLAAARSAPVGADEPEPEPEREVAAKPAARPRRRSSPETQARGLVRAKKAA